MAAVFMLRITMVIRFRRADEFELRRYNQATGKK